MIIIEGPDGSGKTTLAKAICEHFDLEYRRPPTSLLSSTEGPSKELPEWWRAELIRPMGERDRGVYDRCFFISEPIYQIAQVNRDLLIGGAELSRGIFDLWAEGPMMVFCMPPLDVQISTVIQDGRDSLKNLENKHLEKIDFLYWAFWAVWLEAHNEVVHYDYTVKGSREYIYDRLEEFLAALSSAKGKKRVGR